MSPLSLFYLLLQIKQAVNRLQSIRQEPYFHNRVGVKNILQQPCAGDCQNKSYWKREQYEACIRAACRLNVDAEMWKRNSLHLC